VFSPEVLLSFGSLQATGDFGEGDRRKERGKLGYLCEVFSGFNFARAPNGEF
jgi:hypothetical protein